MICVGETELQHIQVNLAALALDVVDLSYLPTQTLFTDDIATTNLERSLEKMFLMHIKKSDLDYMIHYSADKEMSVCVKSCANSDGLPV